MPCVRDPVHPYHIQTVCDDPSNRVTPPLPPLSLICHAACTGGCGHPAGTGHSGGALFLFIHDGRRGEHAGVTASAYNETGQLLLPC